MTFEDLRLEPYFIWLRIPKFKKILNHVEEFPEEVRKFFQHNTKTCDGCRYYVETDKTGTRPLPSISVGGIKNSIELESERRE